MPYEPAGLNIFDPIFGVILLIVASLTGVLWWYRRAPTDLAMLLFFLIPSFGLGARSVAASRDVIALFEGVSVLVGVVFVPLYAFAVYKAVLAHRAADADRVALIRRTVRAARSESDTLYAQERVEALKHTHYAKIKLLLARNGNVL